jgi:hypothetical protein
MARGKRPPNDEPTRRRRLPRRDGVSVKWSELLDYDEAVLLVPRAAPTPAEPDGIELEAWTATRVAGGWEQSKPLKTLKRLPLLRPADD